MARAFQINESITSGHGAEVRSWLAANDFDLVGWSSSEVRSASPAEDIAAYVDFGAEQSSTECNRSDEAAAAGLRIVVILIGDSEIEKTTGVGALATDVLPFGSEEIAGIFDGGDTRSFSNQETEPSEKTPIRHHRC